MSRSHRRAGARAPVIAFSRGCSNPALLACLLITAVLAPAGAATMCRASKAGNRLLKAGESVSGSGAAGKAVVLVVDHVGADEFPSDRTPFCRGLAGKWAAGLMVTRSEGGGAGSGAGYVSLASGVRAKGAPGAALCFDSDETLSRGGGGVEAGEYYRTYTGFSPPEEGVVCLGLQRIKRENHAGKAAAPRLLGSLLGDRGKRAAVAGNSDGIRGPVRLAPLLCSDSRGAVPLGRVGMDVLSFTPDGPGGYTTDVDRLVSECRRLLASSDILIVDTGDTGRIDRETAFTGAGELERAKSRALERVDRIASEIYGMLDPGSSLFMVISPNAPAAGLAQGNHLTPCIAAGKGFGEGMLTSSSTRRAGLVSNTDFLPTVLEFFDIPAPPGVVGAAMETRKASGSAGRLKDMYRQLEVSRKARWPLNIALILFAAVLTALTAPSVYRGARGKAPGRAAGTVGRFIPPAAAVLIAAPLSFLAVSAFSYTGYVFPIVFCTLFSVLVGLGAWFLLRGRRGLDPVVFLCLLTAGVLLGDLFTGGRLVMLPLLGVSSLEGMRFFGLPNTIAAVLIAAGVWAAAGLSAAGGTPVGPPSSLLRLVICPGLSVVALVIGLGVLGANTGGFITAAVTFTVFALCLSGAGITLRRAVLVAVTAAAGTALVVALDVLFFRSHAGRSLGGGVSGVLSMVWRKVSIEVGQIKYFLLPSVLLVIAVVVMALWVRRQDSFWEEEWEKSGPFMSAFYSLLTGGLVAVLFNDTGLAMMGVMTLFSALAVCYYTACGMMFSRPAPANPAG